MDTITVIATVSILIIISPFLSNLIGIPVAVVEMVLGSIAAYVGFFEYHEVMETLAKVGFLYLMFLAGMEVDLKRFLDFQREELRRISLYFITLYSLSLGIFLYFELPSIYFVALPVLSVGMIMALIREHGREHPWLETALTIGIFGELISIGALVVIDGIYQHGFGLEFYETMLTLLFFLIATAFFFRLSKIVFWWYPGIKLRIMPHNDSKNQDIRFSITIFFLMIAIMLYLELEMVLGAFLAGAFLTSYFEHKKELPEKLSAFGFGFLVPIFFIYIGSTLDLSFVLSIDLLQKSFFIIGAMLFMHLISARIAFFSKLGRRDTLLLALSDCMPLTFLIAIATIAHESGALLQHDYFAFVVAAMIEAIIIMVLVKIIKNYFTPELLPVSAHASVGVKS